MARTKYYIVGDEAENNKLIIIYKYAKLNLTGDDVHTSRVVATDGTM